MAIIRLASNRYVGLSTDTKPTTNVELGAFFSESDTGVIYTWTGSAWLAIPLDHKNIPPGNIHVPYDFSFPTAAARTGASYVAGDIGKFIRQTDTDDIYMLISTAPTFTKVSGSGTGEANTASNAGSGGVGPFDNKNVLDLEFRNLVAASSKVTIVLDAGNKNIEFDVDPSNISHDDLADIDTDDHHDQLHAADHAFGGTDEIDGDTLGIDYSPSNYVPITAPSEVTDTHELTAHLAGINNAIGQNVLQQTGNKRPVRLATASALPAYTASGSGVGKFLQANANGALSVDSIGVVTGDRILVKNEIGAAQIHNGIYIVTNPGDGSNKYVLTRTADYDESIDIVAGHIVPVSEGSVNADNVFILTTDAPIAIESSYLIYANVNVQGITSQTVISASANVAVDSILLSKTHTAKWLVDIYDATAGNRKSFEIIGREENLNAQLSSEIGPVGDTIAYVLSATSDGTSMSFKVQNNEANDITVRVRKFEV